MAQPTQISLPQCQELNQACESVLGEAKEVIVLQVDYINRLESNKTQLERALTETNKELFAYTNPPWYSKPETVFLLGIVLGGAGAIYFSGR